jgi:hypothetical protein
VGELISVALQLVHQSVHIPREDVPLQFDQKLGRLAGDSEIDNCVDDGAATGRLFLRGSSFLHHELGRRVWEVAERIQQTVNNLV